MLDHNSPVSRDFGKRGLTPKYRFGRYGPHNKEAFEEEIAWRREGEMSAVTTRERNRDNAMVERRRIVEVEIRGVRWRDYGDMDWGRDLWWWFVRVGFVAQLFLSNRENGDQRVNIYGK